MSLAPIGISTYTRLNHLQEAIEALQNNTLAKKSEVYIFSDAAKPGDEEKVEAVRDFLKTVDGFKQVEIIERQTNSRTYNNRQGMHMLLDQYGKMIFMEEDIVTAPSFLEFMNSALEAYKNNPRIFSIVGHCPPIKIPEDYKYDVFIHPRFDAWGFGTWKDRFDQLEMKIPKQVMKRIYLNPGNLYRYGKGGIDLIPLALNNYFEYADGLDVRICPQQFVLNQSTVYPAKQLVKNIGLDGSGVHKKKKPSYKIDLWQKEFIPKLYPDSLEPDPKIMRSMYKFKSGNYWNHFRQVGWTILILLRRALSI